MAIFDKELSKHCCFLILISFFISIFELLGISLANYMGETLIKTEKTLITPSRILIFSILLFIVWALNLSLKSILVKYIIWLVAVAIAMQSIVLNLTFVLAGSAVLLDGVGMQKIFNDSVIN